MIPGPSPSAVLERLFGEWQSEVHTAFPAVVLAYDAGAQTVEVRPCVKREVPGQADAIWDFEELPDLTNVPVMWPGTRAGSLTFPIVPGDGVLVVCGESATGLWRAGDQVPAEPAFVDPHGLNGCVAIPGWRVDTERLQSVPTDAIRLGHDKGDVRVHPDGSVTVGGHVGAVPLALAPSVKAVLEALSAAVSAAATALAPPTDPATTGAKAAATAIASAMSEALSNVNVAATKAKGV